MSLPPPPRDTPRPDQVLGRTRLVGRRCGAVLAWNRIGSPGGR